MTLWVPCGFGSWREYMERKYPSTLDDAYFGECTVVRVLADDAVFLAKHGPPQAERYVVIKKLDLVENIHSDRDGFWRGCCMEVANTERMSSSGRGGFVAYIGHRIMDMADQVLLVIEYISGPTLDDAIGRPVLGWDWIRGVIMRLLELVQRCHDEGVVHRDIKPDNLMLLDPADPDSLVVIDFGLSAWEGTPWDHGADACVGTCHYYPRESALGQVDITTDRDVYSCGVILYEMLHEERLTPHEVEAGEASDNILRRKLADAPAFPNAGLRQLPWALDFYELACHKDPSQRPSAGELLRHPLIQKRSEQ